MVGCAIARELSFSPASVMLLEAAHDVCEGASKGNTGHRDQRGGLRGRHAGVRPGDAVESEVGAAVRHAGHALPPDRHAGRGAHRGAGATAAGTAGRGACCGRAGRDRQRRGGARAGAAAERGRPRRAALSRRRHRRLDPADHRLRRAGMPQRGRGAAARRRWSACAARAAGSSPYGTPGLPDHGALRRQRRRPGRGRAVDAGRRRRVRHLAAQGSILAARPRDRRPLRQGGRRRAHAAHTRHLRRADDQPLAAARPDRRGPRGSGRPGRRLPHARARVRGRQRSGAQPSPRARHQDVRRQPAGIRSCLPGRPRLDRREPGARRGHPLDRRLVLAGDGRARALAGRSSWSPRPARTARMPSASWSRCRACSGTTVPSSCSTSIPATAR